MRLYFKNVYLNKAFFCISANFCEFPDQFEVIQLNASYSSIYDSLQYSTIYHHPSISLKYPIDFCNKSIFMDNFSSHSDGMIFIMTTKDLFFMKEFSIIYAKFIQLKNPIDFFFQYKHFELAKCTSKNTL